MFFKPTAAKLSKRKSQILGLFTKTQGELILLMEEQQAYNLDLLSKIEKLEEERMLVVKEETSTKKLLNKINEFLS